ncbi:MAG TPA: hypothetical protein VHX86_06145 [Tepidisphaeraceae bacterium]|nr:hypothetical protein [Tepidisphaeraceae bacterium]
MFKQTKPEAIQETHVQPTILQTTDDGQTLQQVPPSLDAPDCPPNAILPQTAASRGLAQTFGLDIRAAILAVIVDLMIFGGEVSSLETLLPLGICAALVLAFIVYKIQMKWHKDDHDSALIKAMIIGLLTAIPVPLTPIIAVPGGILGIISAIRRK